MGRDGGCAGQRGVSGPVTGLSRDVALSATGGFLELPRNCQGIAALVRACRGGNCPGVISRSISPRVFYLCTMLLPEREWLPDPK